MRDESTPYYYRHPLGDLHLDLLVLLRGGEKIGQQEGMKVYHQSTFTRWPFDDNSIQAIITSPPFYSLRKYDIPDVVIGDWKGQYGLEPTFQLYIEHTLLWCREAMRVLRDDGIFFLNLGDSYGGSGGPGSQFDNKYRNRDDYEKYFNPARSLQPKCLLDIPARVSIALVDNQGWIKRNNIIWYKENAMPESVTDRFSKKHEMIYMFTKKPKYYFDLDAVREELQECTIERYKRGWDGDGERNYISGPQNHFKKRFSNDELKQQAIERGKNPGDVWVINTQPSPERHFAMWPEKLVERMIKCSTKAGDTVLDPFAGSGTTLRVADKLNREAYGIDLGYGDIQERRLTNIQKDLL